MLIKKNNTYSLLLELFKATVLAFLLSSCSTYKIADKFTSGKFEKSNFLLKNKVVNNVNVEYWDNEKNKPALVLIHGFGAKAEFQWYKQIKKLEEDYRLIVPSLLYFGETKPLTGNIYEVQDQVNLVSGLLDSLEIKTAHICGVSYGGLVAGEFTRQHSERVKKLILFDAVLKFYTEKEIAQLCETYEVSDFKELFVPKNPKELKRLLTVAYKTPPPVPAFLLKSAQEELYQENLEHLKLLLKAMHSKMSFFQNQDYTFKNKTLLIWGEYDDVVPVSTAKKLDEHLLNSELVIISKTKHMPNLEKPKVFNSLLTEFLKAD